MKLELKHLVPYLPYELNMYYEEPIANEPSEWVLAAKYIDVVIERQNKPILRPLSDLTKEIEVNGKKFIPVDEILKWCKLYWDENRNISPLRDWRYKDIQKILEWHFDVFGLIPAGLAIDINALK